MNGSDFSNFAFAGLGAAIAGFVMTFLIVILSIYVFIIIVGWKLFEKAGKPGWASIIPIYRTIVLFQIVGYKWYYIFFFCLGAVPIIGHVALILFIISFSIKLAKSFGQSIGFGIGLFLVNPIFEAIIAFSKDIRYVGPSVNGDIDFNDLF